MKNPFQYIGQGNGEGSTKRSGAWLRLLCALCATVFCLAALVGCSNYVKAEELSALRAEAANTATEIALMKAAQEVAQSEINALELDKQLLEQEVDLIKENNEAAQAEIDALKGANQSAQAEIDALKGANQSAQAEIDALKGANQSAQDEIDALKGANQSAQAEIDALKGANQSAQAEIDALKGANQSAQAEIDTLKKREEEMQKELENLQKQLEDLANGIQPTEKIRIYIDQGHNPTGNHNAGAVGNGLHEENLTFTMGKLLAEMLEADGRFEVCLSRPTESTVLGTDNTTSLEARVRGAEEFGADYFVSLHINSFSDASVRGLEMLVFAEDTEAYSFGKSVLDSLVAATGLRNRGMKLRPDLYVLRNTTMPAILAEMGFISNAEDAALLSQSPALFVEGIYNGILNHFGLSLPEHVDG